VLSTDFLEILCALEPAIRSARPGELGSVRFPFLRRLVSLGDSGTGAVEPWAEFLARGRSVPQAIAEATAASVQPSDPGLLFFSSGTTDRPKGVLHSHRGVAIQLWRWRRLYDDLEPDVRCWQANGLFWSGAFSMGVGVTFSHGGTLVMQPTFAAPEALELMQSERVNVPLCWPHQWARLTEAPNWSDVDLSGMCHVDRASPLAQHPTIRTDWIEPKAYGVTETFTIVTGYPATSPAEQIRGSFGPPLPGVTLKIVDPLTGEIVPRGERGEIAVKGPTLMLGYLGVPLDETLDVDGFFHTGDGGHLDESDLLFWEGRLTDVIKTGGANVSPREVDGVLAGHPDIRVAQTVGVPHATLGEMVVACVVVHEGAGFDEDALRAFLREKLASYKVPRRILAFRDEELALTGSAKVKASELREMAIRRLDAAMEVRR
jgi:acyl-CoA synthetase (AMP-forming)/AMP-acid ligase II